MRQLDTTSNHRDWHFINTDVKLRSLPEGSPIPLSGLDGEKEGCLHGIDALGNYSADPKALMSIHRNYVVTMVTILILFCAVESRLIDTAGQVDGQTV